MEGPSAVVFAADAIASPVLMLRRGEVATTRRQYEIAVESFFVSFCERSPIGRFRVILVERLGAR